jgi:hypothetical protein
MRCTIGVASRHKKNMEATNEELLFCFLKEYPNKTKQSGEAHNRL